MAVRHPPASRCGRVGVVALALLLLALLFFGLLQGDVFEMHHAGSSL